MCRSLPDLDGSLPYGLPQDVVDDIVRSLMRHSALNATTLRTLKNCEFTMLSLMGCRGVTDEWLRALTSRDDEEDEEDNSAVVDSDDEQKDSDPHESNAQDDESAEYSDNDGPVLMRTSTDPMDMAESMDVETATNPTSSAQSDPRGYRSALPSEQGRDQKEDCTDQPLVASRTNRSLSPSTSSFVSARSSQSAHSDAFGQDDTNTKGMGKTSIGGDGQTGVYSEPLFATPPVKDFIMHGTDTPYTAASIEPMPSLTANLKVLDLRGSQGLTDRGLMQLQDLSSIEVVLLDHCHSLVGRGLVALAVSHRLHTLSLANCRRLTDEAVINISHLMSLEALSLDGCRCITDRALMALANLYDLRKLDLSQCDLISDEGIEHLQDLEHLEELSLGWCRQLTDTGLGHLTNHSGRATTMRVLRLARCPISDRGVRYLGRLRALEELDLNGCTGISSLVLGDVVSELPNLESLDVSYCPGIL